MQCSCFKIICAEAQMFPVIVLGLGYHNEPGSTSRSIGWEPALAVVPLRFACGRAIPDFGMTYAFRPRYAAQTFTIPTI